MTKRRILVKQLLAAGFVYEKGSNHDKYVKGSVTVTVGRHREISDEMARGDSSSSGFALTDAHEERLLLCWW